MNSSDNRIQSLRSGVWWNALGSTINALNSVLMLMAVSRFFDLETTGAFSISLTTAQILYVIGLFGVNDFQMTDYQHEYSFKEYKLAKGISTLIAGMCCFLSVLGLRFNTQKAVFTLLLTGFMLANSYGELFQSQFFQWNRVDLSGQAQFFRMFFSTFVFLLAIITNCSISAACVVMMICSVVCVWIWGIRKVRPFAVDDPHPDLLNRVKKILQQCFPLMLSVLGAQLVINCPKYLINIFSNDEIQGVFGILFMPTAAINLLCMFLYKPYLSEFDHALHRQDGSAERKLKEQMALAACIACISSLFMWFVGVGMINLLFGVNLFEYRKMMVLFVLTGGILAINQLMYYLFVILRLQKAMLLCYLTGLLVAAILGVLLIPLMGLMGAWISFTVSQATVLIIFLILFKRKNDWNNHENNA